MTSREGGAGRLSRRSPITRPAGAARWRQQRDVAAAAAAAGMSKSSSSGTGGSRPPAAARHPPAPPPAAPAPPPPSCTCASGRCGAGVDRAGVQAKVCRRPGGRAGERAPAAGRNGGSSAGGGGAALAGASRTPRSSQQSPRSWWARTRSRRARRPSAAAPESRQSSPRCGPGVGMGLVGAGVWPGGWVREWVAAALAAPRIPSTPPTRLHVFGPAAPVALRQAERDVEAEGVGVGVPSGPQLAPKQLAVGVGKARQQPELALRSLGRMTPRWAGAQQAASPAGGSTRPRRAGRAPSQPPHAAPSARPSSPGSRRAGRAGRRGRGGARRRGMGRCRCLRAARAGAAAGPGPIGGRWALHQGAPKLRANSSEGGRAGAPHARQHAALPARLWPRTRSGAACGPPAAAVQRAWAC